MSEKEHASVDGRIDRLERLAELRDKGALSEDEFQREKARVLTISPTDVPIRAAQFTRCDPAKIERTEPKFDTHAFVQNPIRPSYHNPVAIIAVTLAIAGGLLISVWLRQSHSPNYDSASTRGAPPNSRRAAFEDADGVEWEPVLKCRGGNRSPYRCETQLQAPAVTIH